MTRLERLRAYRLGVMALTVNRLPVITQRQREAVDRITKLTRGFFQSWGAVIFILSGADAIVLSVDVDHAGYAPGTTVPAVQTICAHAKLLPDGVTMQVPDIPSDWRFRQMPHIRQANIQAYCSCARS